MTKYYVLVPCLLLGLFVLIERAYDRSQRETAKLESVRLAAKKALADARVAALKEKTAAETRARTAAREQEERARAEKKRVDFEQALHAAESEVAARMAAVETLRREADALERDLAELKQRKRRVEDVAFGLERGVELQRIGRRNADLEIQRTTKMVLARLNDRAAGH